jgi:hypothetical protein
MPSVKRKERTMRRESSHDLSELERELELYLGREFETGATVTIRVWNTDTPPVDTSVTFTDMGGGTVKISITPGQTFQMTGVQRKQDGTVVGGDVKELPRNGKPYSGPLRLWVQPKQMDVAAATGTGKWAAAVPATTSSYRFHTDQEEATQKSLIDFIRRLAVPEFEFEVGDDDGFELDDDGTEEREGRRGRTRARMDARELEWELDEAEDDDEEFEAADDADELGPEEEADDVDERELDAQEDSSVEERYARRLHELSSREFESEADLDEELGRGLDAMAEEYFVRRLRRKRRRGKGKGVFGKILKAGAKIVGKIAEKTPVGSLIKAGTSLVRGDVKGALGNLAKAAVGTALGPVAGTVATTAIDALGGEEGELGRRRRRAIRRIARISRDTYRELADTLPDDFDHPLVANEVVRSAVRRSMIRNGVPLPRRRRARLQARRRALRRVIRVRPDEEVVLIGGR